MAKVLASRGTAGLVTAVRSDVTAGRYEPGQFLPPVRELSAAHGVSPETVRRALKHLEGEGLLVAEPRQGFRVAAGAGRRVERCPVAYVTGYRPDLSDAQPANWALTRALQDAAGRRGWTTLGAHGGGDDRARLSEQLRAAQAWGAVLDTLDAKLLESMCRLGLPVVMVNSWVEGCDLDVVIQDNYLGGFLAAKHLVESGARRVAWLGPVEQFCHSRERHAGAAAGLSALGAGFGPGMVVNAAGEDAGEAARELLRRDDRPDGVLVFWKGVARAARRAADELGLVIGRDLHLVGWAAEEIYETEHQAVFAGGPIPPAVVWKASSMAERALALLAERRESRGGEAVRACVPTRLKGGAK